MAEPLWHATVKASLLVSSARRSRKRTKYYDNHHTNNMRDKFRDHNSPLSLLEATYLQWGGTKGTNWSIWTPIFWSGNYHSPLYWQWRGRSRFDERDIEERTAKKKRKGKEDRHKEETQKEQRYKEGRRTETNNTEEVKRKTFTGNSQICVWDNLSSLAPACSAPIASTSVIFKWK